MEEEILKFKNFYNKYFKKYSDIIKVIDDNKDINGLSKISQKEIAERLTISPSLVSKCIKRLERSDKCIEKVKPSIYKVNHIDMINYGPYPKFLKYLLSVSKYDQFLELTWEEKAKILSFSKEEVIMANAYLIEYAKYI